MLCAELDWIIVAGTLGRLKAGKMSGNGFWESAAGKSVRRSRVDNNMGQVWYNMLRIK